MVSTNSFFSKADIESVEKSVSIIIQEVSGIFIKQDIDEDDIESDDEI